MALKGDRDIVRTDITHVCDSVAERGNVLVYKANSSGSGNALGDARGTATLATDPSGLMPAGLLLNDFVSIDESQYHRNYHKDQMKVGEPATLLRQGWVVTNRISGNPVEGNIAYLTASGALTPTVSATGGVKATPPVGEFNGSKDENGFAKVTIQLPAFRSVQIA